MLTLAPIEATPAPTPPAPVVVPPPPAPVTEPEPVAKAAPDELAQPAPKAELTPALPITVHAAPAAPPAPTPAPAPAAPPPMPVSIAGVQAPRAQHVVYVVDASGAMTSSLKFVKEELARSIARLDSSQSFQVVVFRELPGTKDGDGFEMPPSSSDRLMPVTNESRVSSTAWLAGIQPGGRSDPLAGLTAALKLKPDLIFLLTRSIRRSGAAPEWGAGTAATLEALDKLNPKHGRNGLRPTVIKAIQFLDEDPTGLLPAIADAHGDGEGSYKVLRQEEVAK